ncbi:uncharacterized protein GLRG_10696 [Colletotrichum graminicola M1.001]|uniref:HRQ family protein 2 n=1 Tax=Colletotrichum graminicola (strain M1.001 / M2 / FGSC 10212) TaxID=645133 RepID=E3QXG4_COLGM|nr:uncharacterized protein GLRG_10696 [Colletotrichum graminicola M1.001]EFQ35552.1 hypothetical protein GLRG_10696 [Colletotrichum graminicola M1.001]
MYLAVAAAVAVAIVLLSVWRRRWRYALKMPSSPRTIQEKPSRLDIEPLSEFDWRQNDPTNYRSFKPVYHITMAIQASAPEDLIIFDKAYLDRVTNRRRILKENTSKVAGAVPEGIPALHETWTYLLSEYLPTRYPTMFSLSEDGAIFQNHITNISLPTTPPEDPDIALQALGETVEDDIFLLVETPEGHRAVAFVCCHPAGFDPSDKLGKLMKDIHRPVPSYDKIGASMERFFSRLQVGKSVKRLNWSVSTHDKLFSPSDLHIYNGDSVEEDEEVDISKACLRQELQTLTRLPETGAILFSFKTYLTPIEQIKNEGYGLQLADAIEGLKYGNAPGMWVYKGAARWGKSVCEYLRS